MNSHEALLEVQSIGMEYPSWTFTLNMKKKNIYKSTKKYQKIPKQQTYVKICGCLGPTWAKAEAGPGALGFPRLEIVVIAQVLSHVAHVTGIAGFNKMADDFSPVNSQIHIFDCHPYTMTHFETTELLLDAFYFHRNNLSIQGEQLASPFRTVSSYIHFLHFPFHLSLCAISVAMHIPCQRRSYHFVILQDQGQGSATQQECGFWQNKPNLDLK